MTSPPPAGSSRSKAVATWLALVGGSLGLHRFYLHGARDAWAWLHPLPTLVGAYGFWRMREFGVDDARGSLLVPAARRHAGRDDAAGDRLRPDERRALGGAPRPDAAGPARPAWPTLVAVAVALAVGASIAVATIAFTAQRYFESRAEIR